MALLKGCSMAMPMEASKADSIPLWLGMPIVSKDFAMEISKVQLMAWKRVPRYWWVEPNAATKDAPMAWKRVPRYWWVEPNAATKDVPMDYVMEI
jgi:hypothetical protein